jgi:hypothetical protein
MTVGKRRGVKTRSLKEKQDLLKRGELKQENMTR